MNYRTELSVFIYIYIYIGAVACNIHCGITVSHYRENPTLCRASCQAEITPYRLIIDFSLWL